MRSTKAARHPIDHPPPRLEEGKEGLEYLDTKAEGER